MTSSFLRTFCPYFYLAPYIEAPCFLWLFHFFKSIAPFSPH